METYALQQTETGIFQALSTVILKETLIGEIEYKEYWNRIGDIIIGDAPYNYTKKRSIENAVIDYAERKTITPILILAEKLDLNFNKRLSHAEIMLPAVELGFTTFPAEFVVSYATQGFPWREIGRNVKIVTEPIQRGKRDKIIFSYSYNPDSVQEITLDCHKFRPKDYLLFAKITE